MTDLGDLDGPVCDYRTPVLERWIDENQHMDSLYYKEVANGGLGALLRRAGLTRKAFAEHHGTMFQAEMHVCFERELRLGDAILVRSWLIGADAKRLHNFHELVRESDGARAATVELMTLYISSDTRRAAPMPPDIAGNFAAIAAAHARLPQPTRVGSAIAMRRPA